MSEICMNCYDRGLVAFVQSRAHRISEVTVDTYLRDGRRFKNFFIEGYMRVKGSGIQTIGRGVSGLVRLHDLEEFLSALLEGGMRPTSAEVYRTPVEGAFAFAPQGEHK